MTLNQDFVSLPTGHCQYLETLPRSNDEQEEDVADIWWVTSRDAANVTGHRSAPDVSDIEVESSQEH